MEMVKFIFVHHHHQVQTKYECVSCLQRLLMSVLWKMTHCSRFCPLTAQNHNQVIKLSSDQTSIWVRVSPKLSENASSARQTPMPGARAKTLYLTHFLGGSCGDDSLSRTYIGVVGRSFNRCVVKVHPNAALLEAERRNWIDVWGFDAKSVRVQTFHDVNCLLMPVLRTCSAAAEERERIAPLVQQAARRCVAHHKVHADLQWRHVAFVRRDGVVEVVFLDTAGMREIVEGDGDEDQVFDGMMRVLYPQHIAAPWHWKCRCRKL
jgi:hypothetical protein